MEPQRESAREGQVEEGVRVALLKLVTDGSRPIGEMSDNYSQKQEMGMGIKYTEFVGCVSAFIIYVMKKLYFNFLCIIFTLQSLILLITRLYSLLKVCVRRRRHYNTTNINMISHRTKGERRYVA